MIGTRQPKSFFPAHSCVADNDILNYKHKRVSGMQISSNIRRGENDGKWLGFGRGHFFFNTNIGIKKTAVFPQLINSLFGFFRIIWSKQLFRQFVVHIGIISYLRAFWREKNTIEALNCQSLLSSSIRRCRS